MDKYGPPVVTPINCHTDDRGYLWQIFGANLKFPEVKRIYVVGNYSRGIIRGFHKHNHEWKAYFIPSGSAKFVTIDEGDNISTFILSDKKGSVLVIPPNISHGWKSLSENTMVIGLSNKSLKESIMDDYREDPFSHGKEIWETKMR